MNEKSLLPIEIIHFDPVKREIVNKNVKNFNILYSHHPNPCYFDISSGYKPADRIIYSIIGNGNNFRS